MDLGIAGKVALVTASSKGLGRASAVALAADLFPSGITLNLVCPGPHGTDRMLQLGGSGPMGDPADFGRLVAFMCSAHAGYISGAAYMVDGASSSGLL